MISNTSPRSNYPLMSQSEWNNAPFNDEELPPQEVEVTVSMTLSKTVRIKVSDYRAEKATDEDGTPVMEYDFSDCDLKAAVQEQLSLPNEAFDSLHSAVFMSGDRKAAKAVQDLKGWNVDDYEVVLE